MPKPKPVTVEELEKAVLDMILQRFKGRPLDIETARRALSAAAYELNVLHIKAMVKKK
jgi:hypothetical protein